VSLQRLRVPIGFIAALSALYLARPTGWSLAIGLPIALAGGAFRFLAAGTIRKNAELSTLGPYAWTRNPLYLGSSLLALGFAVMSNSAGAAALLLAPSAIIYPNVIAREEEALEQLFPEEFAAYRESVPMFFPRFRQAPMGFSMRQYIANREYNTAVGFAGAMGVFVMKWLAST
jgi:protein-S-isoprenylcysteine O-methyltransferase Ste14